MYHIINSYIKPKDHTGTTDSFILIYFVYLHAFFFTCISLMVFFFSSFLFIVLKVAQISDGQVFKSTNIYFGEYYV